MFRNVEVVGGGTMEAKIARQAANAGLLVLLLNETLEQAGGELKGLEKSSLPLSLCPKRFVKSISEPSIRISGVFGKSTGQLKQSSRILISRSNFSRKSTRRDGQDRSSRRIRRVFQLLHWRRVEPRISAATGLEHTSSIHLAT